MKTNLDLFKECLFNIEDSFNDINDDDPKESFENFHFISTPNTYDKPMPSKESLFNVNDEEKCSRIVKDMVSNPMKNVYTIYGYEYDRVVSYDITIRWSTEKNNFVWVYGNEL